MPAYESREVVSCLPRAHVSRANKNYIRKYYINKAFYSVGFIKYFTFHLLCKTGDNRTCAIICPHVRCMNSN